MDIVLRGAGWTHHDGVAVRGHAFNDGELLTGEALAAQFRAASEDNAPLGAVAESAATLEGFYAAVVSTDTGTSGATLLVADEARSIPLYYAAHEGIVSDRGGVIRDALGAGRDPVTECEFILTRYVTGPETIWNGVRATQAGAVISLKDGNFTERTYREYWPAGGRGRGGGGDGDPTAQLKAALERSLDRLERVAGSDDRPIVVPLSGGYDSRLIASALVERGRDVIGFTFGRAGYPDVEVSREVAARLGIRWEFVPYDEDRWNEWYHSTRCRRYRERAFGGDALPFIAEWPALCRLIDDGRLPADALFCPGHTVATPSERLPTFVGESRDWIGGSVGCGADENEPAGKNTEFVDPSVDGLIEYILEEHYTLWDLEPSVKLALRERIRRGLLGDRSPAAITDPAAAAASYERWEWRGRMTTFTNGDLRAYEDRGLDWWLPLWDSRYVRAWERVPLAERRNKRLHAALATESYRRAGNARERASVIDRTLPPADRVLSKVRHTPERQFFGATPDERDWEPPFLSSNAAWSVPTEHPLAWFGAVDDALLEQAPNRSFYAFRTLAAAGYIDLADSSSSVGEFR